MLASNIYYINENDNSREYLSGKNDFFVLSNNDCISITYKVSILKLKYYPEIYYNSYPFDSNDKITFTLTDIFIKHYEILETVNSVIFFLLLDTNPNSYTLDIYVLNKKTKSLEKTETLYEDIAGFELINISKNTTNNFIYCITELAKSSKCFLAKYEKKKIISENYIEVFDWQCVLTRDFLKFKKNYALLDDEKIALVCSSTFDIKLTIFEYKNNDLKLNKEVYNKEIMSLSYSTKISNIFLDYNSYKGLILYNIIENLNDYTFAVYKMYFEEVCSSFNIITKEFIKTDISFIDYIFGGNTDTQPKFYITQIDPKITLYDKDNKIVKPGNTVHDSSDSFTFISAFSETPLTIKFRNINNLYSCSAVIDIFYYKIEILDKSYKCDINPESSLVNNITSLDLNKTYDINIDSNFVFNIEFVDYVQEQDLVYKYDNVEFRCSRTSGVYAKSIKCLFPENFEFFPPNTIKYEYNIYSTLSCLNSIYIGTIKIEDPYLLEIIDADNLTEISQGMDKTSYDPSEKIKKFSVDMINYYYWFSSFQYCDDEFIESGECCQEEILTDWEIISYKKYFFDYEFLRDYLGFSDLTMRTKIEEIYKLDENEVDLEIMDADIIRYVIFKSKKFKKYIITFGLDNYMHSSFIAKMIFSEIVNFENNSDILINKYLYLLFNMTINDIFSKNILKEINENKNYQYIFIGHSIGGALANLASYYYAKHKLAENEPVLITFGQPRVGNENFARDYMKLISNVYRIQRYKDTRTMYPPIKKQEDVICIKELKKIKFVIDIYFIISGISTVKSLLDIAKRILFIADSGLGGLEDRKFIQSNFLSSVANSVVEEVDEILTQIADQISSLIPFGYCHIGGLYVLNEEINKFYHCKDIYNENAVTSPYCKNRDLQYGKDGDIKEENFYFTDKQNPMERCQAFKYGERFLLYP